MSRHRRRRSRHSRGASGAGQVVHGHGSRGGAAGQTVDSPGLLSVLASILLGVIKAIATGALAAILFMKVVELADRRDGSGDRL